MSIEFRPDLQGLRALAVLLVITAHSGLGFLPGGFVGVDVFFVLSGYLITGLLLKEYQTLGRIHFLSFYARRFRRLLPAMLVVVAVSCLLALGLLSVERLRSQVEAVPFVVAWVSNFYYAFRQFGYFDEPAGNELFLHTWSLGVEEQFYLLWPVFLLALLLVAKGAKRSNTVIFALMIVSAVGSFALSWWWLVQDARLAFYMMPSRIWQFALGGMAFLAFGTAVRDRHSDSRRAYLAVWSGIVLIISAAFFLHSENPYPGPWALLPSLGAFLVIAAGQAARSRALSNPAMVWLGDRSYSLYLWHWPVFLLGFLWLESPGWQSVLLLVGISLLLSDLTYRWVELPFWKGRFRQVQPRSVLLVGILLIALLALVSQLFLRHSSGGNTQKTLQGWKADAPVIYAAGCDTWYQDAKLKPCVVGNVKATNTVAFIGDSIGTQWFSILPAMFPESEWKIIVLTKSACPVVDEDYFYERIGKVYEVCRVWRESAVTYLQQLRPDFLFIGNSATYRFSESEWVDGTRRLLKRLSPAIGVGLIIPGTPQLRFNGPECLERHNHWENGAQSTLCESAGQLEKREAVVGYLEEAAAEYPNIEVLNLNDLVCPNGVCQALNDEDVVVFRDWSHLTDTFVRSIAVQVAQRFATILANRRREQSSVD